MKKNDSGFTLIELLITIAIVGILATVAIPYYMSHQIKAKLSEVENAIATVKSAVTAYYQDGEGTWPNARQSMISEIAWGLKWGALQGFRNEYC